MKKIDLHVHSTYSDGTFSPAELVKEAVLGLRLRCSLSFP